jgi:hypothetical protein
MMPRSVTVRRGVDLAREVREMRARHLRALSEPMLGAQMVHDPWIPPDGTLPERRAIQYAAALARRAGVIGADASGFDGSFDPATATVRLEGADSAVEYVIPERIMAYDPDKPALPAPSDRSPATIDATYPSQKKADGFRA